MPPTGATTWLLVAALLAATRVTSEARKEEDVTNTVGVGEETLLPLVKLTFGEASPPVGGGVCYQR
jgi:hypothetical protein